MDGKNLKIIDFGLSNFYEKKSQKLKTPCGSPCYAAPEMICGLEYQGLPVDLWSCGVILYAMLCGHLPFEDRDTQKLYDKIIACDFLLPNYISDGAKDLIKKLLVKEPTKRLGIKDIKQHPWVNGNLTR